MWSSSTRTAALPAAAGRARRSSAGWRPTCGSIRPAARLPTCTTRASARASTAPTGRSRRSGRRSAAAESTSSSPAMTTTTSASRRSRNPLLRRRHRRTQPLPHARPALKAGERRPTVPNLRSPPPDATSRRVRLALPPGRRVGVHRSGYGRMRPRLLARVRRLVAGARSLNRRSLVSRSMRAARAAPAPQADRATAPSGSLPSGSTRRACGRRSRWNFTVCSVTHSIFASWVFEWPSATSCRISSSRRVRSERSSAATRAPAAPPAGSRGGRPSARTPGESLSAGRRDAPS